VKERRDGEEKKVKRKKDGAGLTLDKEGWLGEGASFPKKLHNADRKTPGSTLEGHKRRQRMSLENLENLS